GRGGGGEGGWGGGGRLRGGEVGGQFRAIARVVYARRGRCDEVEAQLPALEQALAQAAPKLYEPDQPPTPRTAEDVRELRRDLSEIDAYRARLEADLKTGSLKEIPDLREIPQAGRRATAEAAPEELRRARRGDSPAPRGR